MKKIANSERYKIGWKVLYVDRKNDTLLSYVNNTTQATLPWSKKTVMRYYKNNLINLPDDGNGPLAVFENLSGAISLIKAYLESRDCTCEKKDFVVYQCFYKPSKANGLWIRDKNGKRIKYTQKSHLPYSTTTADEIVLLRKERI
jgi:hypothetical protein